MDYSGLQNTGYYLAGIHASCCRGEIAVAGTNWKRSLVGVLQVSPPAACTFDRRPGSVILKLRQGMLFMLASGNSRTVNQVSRQCAQADPVGIVLAPRPSWVAVGGFEVT